MQVELEAIAKVSLEHRHIAAYLEGTEPLDRIILLRKGLEAFTLEELTALEGYIRKYLGDDVNKKAATLAVCQYARELQKLTE